MWKRQVTLAIIGPDRIVYEQVTRNKDIILTQPTVELCTLSTGDKGAYQTDFGAIITECNN
jgi:hypothetical protein